ncbi:unnamed protein product [Amoebophrya sp. A25]|nr:unnamed protein product [Amoebophrya sp. A25]|eukprot:GSA25T00019843001.1
MVNPFVEQRRRVSISRPGAPGVPPVTPTSTTTVRPVPPLETSTTEVRARPRRGPPDEMRRETSSSRSVIARRTSVEGQGAPVSSPPATTSDHSRNLHGLLGQPPVISSPDGTTSSRFASLAASFHALPPPRPVTPMRTWSKESGNRKYLDQELVERDTLWGTATQARSVFVDYVWHSDELSYGMKQRWVRTLTGYFDHGRGFLPHELTVHLGPDLPGYLEAEIYPALRVFESRQRQKRRELERRAGVGTKTTAAGARGPVVPAAVTTAAQTQQAQVAVEQAEEELVPLVIRAVEVTEEDASRRPEADYYDVFYVNRHNVLGWPSLADSLREKMILQEKEPTTSTSSGTTMSSEGRPPAHALREDQRAPRRNRDDAVLDHHHDELDLFTQGITRLLDTLPSRSPRKEQLATVCSNYPSKHDGISGFGFYPRLLLYLITTCILFVALPAALLVWWEHRSVLGHC